MKKNIFKTLTPDEMIILYRIVSDLLTVPSINDAILKGEFTADEARTEFTSQILACDTENGLAYVEDIPELLKQDILQVAG